MKKNEKNGSANQAQNKSPKKGVKANSDASHGLRELFINQLQDIYWAEKALTKAIPKMIDNATHENLTEALTEHLEVTKQQLARLEEVFSTIGEKAEGKKCEAMSGLIKEAEEIIAETENGTVRDAGIIAAAQKVEHYEIATYGTLASFARTLGEENAAELLEETLAEEKEADELLTHLAETSINIDATEEGSDNQEELETVTATKSKRK